MRGAPWRQTCGKANLNLLLQKQQVYRRHCGRVVGYSPENQLASSSVGDEDQICIGDRTFHEVAASKQSRAGLRTQRDRDERTPESTQKSVAFFQQAVEKDPHYAAAYLALGEAYALLVGNTIAAPRDAVPKAKEAANRALELDPGMGEAYATLAHLAFFYDWNLQASETQLRRAIELSPQ